MSRYLLLAAAGLALLAGCAPIHGMHYDIMLDTSLTPSQVEDAMTARASWEAAIPGLTLDYTVSACHDYQGKAHTICVFWDSGDPAVEASPPNPLALATTMTRHDGLLDPNGVDNDSATIHLWSLTMDRNNYNTDVSIANIISHELGHAMTHRSSHIASGNLMQPTDAPNVMMPQTPFDVSYFWSTR